MNLNPPYTISPSGGTVYDKDGKIVCLAITQRLPGSLVAKLLNEYARLAKLRERLVDAVVVEEETVDDGEVIKDYA